MPNMYPTLTLCIMKYVLGFYHVEIIDMEWVLEIKGRFRKQRVL
jgi:hypothetical protein